MANAVDERDRTVERVSLGSYEMTTRIAREGGTIGPDQRMYHLDGYAPGRHVTYRMFTSEPSYDEVRKMVVEIFEGKLEALSSTTEDGE